MLYQCTTCENVKNGINVSVANSRSTNRTEWSSFIIKLWSVMMMHTLAFSHRSNGDSSLLLAVVIKSGRYSPEKINPGRVCTSNTIQYIIWCTLKKPFILHLIHFFPLYGAPVPLYHHNNFSQFSYL